MTQSKTWIFTWNNPDYEAEQPNVWPDVRFAIWQHEVGDSGTPHYQGYVVFTKNTRLAWLVKNLPDGIHWEVRRGTHDEAVAYCKKEETRTDGPFTFGEYKPQQGKRSDLIEVAEYVKTHTMKETAETYPGTFIRCHRGISAYANLVKYVERPIDKKTELVVYWGVQGSGKSHMAKTMYPNHFALMRPRANDGGCWWDGYEQQDTVIIDEFFGWMQPDLLCRLVDSGKAQVETKGGSIAFNSKRIVITSNTDPWFWWKVEYRGMERRLNEASISYFPRPLPKPVPEGFEPLQYSPQDPLYPPRTDQYARSAGAYAMLLAETRAVVEQNNTVWVESGGEAGRDPYDGEYYRQQEEQEQNQ